MSIRVCSGIHRSRLLACPAGKVRPTSDRVKEAIFSTLATDIAGLTVLDLYAGSGSLGIEALSRGGAAATFVDVAHQSVDTIRHNLAALELVQSARVVRQDVRIFSRTCRLTFDLIFMDPPYNKGLATESAPRVYRLLNPGGVLVVEHSPHEVLDMQAWKERLYGDTMISYFTREDT